MVHYAADSASLGEGCSCAKSQAEWFGINKTYSRALLITCCKVG